MSSREARRATFDTVAEEYDRHRPSYPEQLVDDVVELSGISGGGRVLEIGSGTGKATLPFAQRGFDITCVERGANLARVAGRHLAPFPNVRIVVSGFEEWPDDEAPFDLVFAAQSFHFLDSASALPRIARLLRAGGALAVFGNHAVRNGSPVADEIQRAYATHAPGLDDSTSDHPLEDRIDETGRFGTVIMTRYRWRRSYSADDYIALLETQSPHRLLPDEQRSALLGAIRSAIEASQAPFTVEYLARLHLARRTR